MYIEWSFLQFSVIRRHNVQPIENRTVLNNAKLANVIEKKSDIIIREI